MKKQTETETQKLTLKKSVLKDLKVRTGVKAGLGTQQCHPQTGISCAQCTE